MATANLSRSDTFPVGTSVGIYPGGAWNPGGAPRAQVIASATVDAAGNLSVTNAGILSGTEYVAYALVNGENRYLKLRSTLDGHDRGIAVGTGDTTNNSTDIVNAAASSGAFAEGQIITGPGIPPQARIFSIAGSTLTMDTKATATATGVALVAYGAGAWRAKVRRRRVAVGTS
jgi:hypothetical protein